MPRMADQEPRRCQDLQSGAAVADRGGPSRTASVEFIGPCRARVKPRNRDRNHGLSSAGSRVSALVVPDGVTSPAEGIDLELGKMRRAVREFELSGRQRTRDLPTVRRDWIKQTFPWISLADTTRSLGNSR